MKKKWALILILSSTILLAAESADKALRNGVDLFREGKFAEALAQFLSAEEAAPDSLLPTYNAITAMANAERLAEMEEKLTQRFADLGKDPAIRADSAYNLATAYLSVAAAADLENKLPEAAMELEKSIQWLKQSLLDNHDDVEAKNNLEYALKLREKLQQQQQEQNQQDQQNQNQQQDQDQQQQEQNQQQQEQQDNQQQNEQQKQQQDQNQQKQQQQEQKEISDATAENLLQAAKDAEKRAMKMMREQKNRKNRKKSPSGKDW